MHFATAGLQHGADHILIDRIVLRHQHAPGKTCPQPDIDRQRGLHPLRYHSRINVKRQQQHAQQRSLPQRLGHQACKSGSTCTFGFVGSQSGTMQWEGEKITQRVQGGAADGIRVHDFASEQTSAIGTDGYRILWSPDDSRMMYTTTFGLNVANADGSGLQRVDTVSAQVISPTGWIDDQTIVYAVMGGDGFTFTSYNLQGGETKSLFTIQNKAGYGAISPDGGWIVFADRLAGKANWGIFISRLDGSERKLVVEPEVSTAFMSVWGPDGQWLIVNTRDANDKNIPVLVNPFTCEVFSLNQVNGVVEGWSP